MKEINLEEILLEVVVNNNNSFDIDEDYKITEDVIYAMKESCRQALELAAENAKIFPKGRTGFGEDIYDIDKQSILNTINQVK